MPALTTTNFDQDCREAVSGLRGALLGVYRDVGADPTAPQEVSRRFKLNKNLTWKIARILQSEDAMEAATHVPGSSGLSIFVRTMEGAGASSDSIERLRSAADAFERMVEIHVGDRATLDLTLDSMDGGGRALERSRQLAFKGNSGIWGIRCRTRVAAHFAAPSRDKADMLDLAFVAGWTGVRRLRPIERWPAFQVYLRHDDGSEAGEGTSDMPLTDDGGARSWMLDEFRTGAMPEVYSRRVPDGICYEFGDGPVGRTGEFGCFYGNLRREAVPRFASERDRLGEFHVGITVPASVLLFDMFVHQELSEALSADVLVRGRLRTHFDHEDHSLIRLPISTRVHDLGRNPAVATPLIGRYHELVQTAMARGGWDLREFHCLRLVLEYPPMPSTVTMQYRLLDRGG